MGTQNGFKEVCELIELNDAHPSQRIAYWFCRWAQEIAQTDNELFRACINHLLSLKGDSILPKGSTRRNPSM